ncbi:hypothetical protein BDZ91DRAFT_717361 [Kalaharituber pfeilii]|nr:hypothetical protein BDZ91DRAFT_717361 [Kalaharituber pfeilii]
MSGRRVSGRQNRSASKGDSSVIMEHTAEVELKSDKKEYFVEDLDEYLQERLRLSVIASKTSEEWNGKMRFVIAVLFLRFRHLGDKSLKKLLNAVIPTSKGVIAVNKEMVNVRTYQRELQDAAFEIHEALAKTWLTSVDGLAHVQETTLMRQSNNKKCLPKVTAEDVAKWLHLSAAEVGAIWKYCTFTISPGYFQASSWGKGDGLSRHFHDHLKQTSYALIASYINYVMKANAAQCGVSIAYRQRDFWDTSDLTSPPTLHPKIYLEHRMDAQDWENFLESYPNALRDGVVKSLIARLKGQFAAKAKESELEDSSADEEEVEESQYLDNCSMSGGGDRDADISGDILSWGENPEVVTRLDSEVVKKKGAMPNKVKSKKKVIADQDFWEGPGSEYDVSTPMIWGTKDGTDDILGPEEMEKVRASVAQDIDEIQEITKCLLPEEYDEHYITEQAIQWAKTSPAGKIDMTIRVVLAEHIRGNEALYLLEQRQARLAKQIADLVELQKESRLKIIGTSIAVDKYHSAAEERVALEKSMRTSNSAVPAIEVKTSSLSTTFANSGATTSYNRRRDIRIEDLYNRIQHGSSSDVAGLLNEHGKRNLGDANERVAKRLGSVVGVGGPESMRVMSSRSTTSVGGGQ